MDDITPRKSLAAIRADIRGRLDAAKFAEERMMALDIKAQRLRASAAMTFFTHYAEIEAACQRRGITVGSWCKTELGCGVKHLRKLRQLHQRWNDYVAKRQSYDGDRYGLRLAFTMVGIPTDGESSAPLWAIKTMPAQMLPTPPSALADFWLNSPRCHCDDRGEFREILGCLSVPFARWARRVGDGLAGRRRRGLYECAIHPEGRTARSRSD